MNETISKEEKLKRLKVISGEINKEHGVGALMSLSEKPRVDENIISSGSLMLDYAIGIGGYPRGRIIEIYGPESSGKTTIAIHAIAEAQKAGGIAALIDAEHAFDKEYARNLGVNVDELMINQPSTGEEGLEIADKLISSGAVDIVVVDSVAALVPKSELEGAMGDSKMGVHARLMSQAMRKLAGTVDKNNVLLIFINQTREKIGVMYGSPITTTGGNALKFYCSVRMDVSKSQIKEGDEVVGNTTKVKIVKNKVAAPFKVVEFAIRFGEGIDKEGEIIDLGVEKAIIKKAGSWYSYGDVRLGQGSNGVKSFLSDNPELMEEIKKQVKQKIYE